MPVGQNIPKHAGPALLLFALSGLGDALFFLPALAAWRRREPTLRVMALTMFPAVRDFLAHSPLVDEVIHREFIGAFPTGSLAFFLGLRRRCFDYGVLPYGSNRLEYNLAHALSGARRRLAHRYRIDPWYYFNRLNHVRLPQAPGRHAVEANAALLAAAGLIGPEAVGSMADRAWLEVPETARTAAQPVPWEEQTFVGVHAGSNTIKNQARKCYPPPLLAAALIEIARRHPGVRFLIFEGAADRARTDALAAALPAALFHRIVPADILQTAALIDRCAFFLANDSGLLHLAAFRGKPCLAIFGPTPAADARPWTASWRTAALGLPCQPCFEYSGRPLACPAGIDFSCLRGLPPRQVAEAFDALAAEVIDSKAGSRAAA